jgi:subtilisin family serine protease
MKFIPLTLAIICTHHLASANLRGKLDDGDNDRVLQGASDGGTGGAGGRGHPEYAPGEYLVKFKPGASQPNRGQAMAASRSEVGEKIVTAAMRNAGDDEGVTLMRTGMAVPEAVQAMLASGTVEYAEPNYIYKHDATSNDPYSTSGSLWGMFSPTPTGGGGANQYGIGATTAWAKDKTDCSNVYVGIIDEGYMFTHADLAANAGKNPGEIAGDGIDNDGNGYIDDVYGWDFYNNDKSVYDDTGDDHGTHVAGTIGAVGGNGIGVAGVCWSVKLLSGKFLGPNGGSSANAIKALDYFTTLKTRQGLNIVATNNSWGGGGYSQSLSDAIERANNANILFVAAAGNASTNNDATPSYPSSYTNANVIAVASITSTGALSSFSNYGGTSVDIGAPGSSIMSTIPAGGYIAYSGTSMATPHVTGAAALYKALYPQATAAEIKAAILNGATPTTSLTGKVLTGGRLNVAGFLTPLAPTTSSPTKAPTPATPPPTKAPTPPTPPPTPPPTATCRAKSESCLKRNCGSSCCCLGLTCGGRSGSETCR